MKHCIHPVLSSLYMAVMIAAAFNITGLSAYAAPQEIDISVLKNANPGDYIEFGHYEQDGDLSNGIESIEWLVLDARSIWDEATYAYKYDALYLISRYVLDSMPFNSVDEPVNWDSCSLNGWLNEEFIDRAFSYEEQGYIVTKLLTNADNTVSGRDGGNDTLDRVFLLSIDECERYFPNGIVRMAKQTKQTYLNGSWSYDWNEDMPHMLQEVAERHENKSYSTGFVPDANVFWWLRSPVNDTGLAARVTHDGGVTVRPAMVSDTHTIPYNSNNL